MQPSRRKIFACALSLDIFIIDQLSKYLALRFFPTTTSLNNHIAFSFPIPNSIMLFLTPLLLAGVCFFAFRFFTWEHWLSMAVFGLILGGGLSNFSDRLLRGGVVDFIELGFWPSFNLADIFITVSAFLLIFFHAKILVSHGRTSQE